MNLDQVIEYLCQYSTSCKYLHCSWGLAELYVQLDAQPELTFCAIIWTVTTPVVWHFFWVIQHL